MAEYRATTTEITVHRTDHDPMHHGGVRVQLAGTKESGYFICLKQQEDEIELDPEELSPLLEACKELLHQQVLKDGGDKTRPSTTSYADHCGPVAADRSRP